MTLVIPINSDAQTSNVVTSPNTSFVKRRLRVVLTLADQVTYQGTNANTLTIEGLRIIVKTKYAGAVAPEATVEIYGMKQDDMNSLTMLAWKALSIKRNTIQIFALDAGAWFEVFHGNILDAVPDYEAAPDVPLRINAISLLFDKLAKANPTSYKGSVAAADVIGKLAGSINYTFENQGVTALISNPYYPGTVVDQMRAVATAADCDLFVDGTCVAISLRAQPRDLPTVVISPSTGLIGYPSIDNQGIRLSCLWVPGLRIGAPVRIVSDIPKANGDWRIYSLSFLLESERPDGQWFAEMGVNEFVRAAVSQDRG